jgi:mercuric ion transport protein
MNREIKASWWPTMGAIGAAVAASLCCILPVGAAALGVAGFAASEFFTAWRPYLLALTVALLGVGFYLSYRARTVKCEPNSLCERPVFVRSSRTALWIVGVLVIVIAAFPYYSGTLVRAFGREPGAPKAAIVPVARAVLSIQGMDCTACAALIEKKLAGIQGVRDAKVSFQRKVAAIDYDPRVVTSDTFVKAIEKGGYKATLIQSQGQE